MPPRLALIRRFIPLFGLILVALEWLPAPLAGQELPLLRDYPGSGRYQCPAPETIVTPELDVINRASLLADDATQALLLGDFERSQRLLAQATALDPTSADYRYRHAIVLENIGDADNALVEYCRALELDDGDDLGAFDVRQRIDALYEQVRERIPEVARDAFVRGLAEADSASFEEAAGSFTEAIEAAPEWGAPVYNRGIVYEQLGRIGASLTDYRRYIDLAPTDIDPILVMVSERIGELEGAASVVTPNPTGAFALGLVPGMGHYYTGRPMIGTVTLGTAGTAVAAGLMFRKITTFCVNEVPPGGGCPDGQVDREVTERPYLWYGIGIAAAVTLVSAVDALLDARERRAEAEAIMGPLGGSNGDGDPDGADAGGSAGSVNGLAFVGPSLSGSGTRLDLNLVGLRFR